MKLFPIFFLLFLGIPFTAAAQVEEEECLLLDDEVERAKCLICKAKKCKDPDGIGPLYQNKDIGSGRDAAESMEEMVEEVEEFSEENAEADEEGET